MKLKVYLWICWRYFIQFLFKTLTNFQQREDLISFSYWIDGQKYRIIIPTSSPRIQTYTAETIGKDITQEIIEYAGIGKNFGGFPITPRFLGYEYITISTLTGDIRYDIDREIILPRRC